MKFPRYSYPPGLFAKIVRDVILLRRRDFRMDAKACIKNIDPPLQMLGNENIPQRGPFLITINHYHRPGFGAQWLALAVAAHVPVPIHWIITEEWTYPGKWCGPASALGSRILLKRIASVYGFTRMPPMPPRPRDLEARARSVRAVLAYVRRTTAPVIGLAPEGHDAPHGVLLRPAAGVGRFALLLARAGLRFLPVGAYEAHGAFHLNFGEGYELSVPTDLPVGEKDDYATDVIMRKLACLLPAHLRGEFA